MATEISSLGEFGLIDRLTRDFPLVNESSVLGVGDDAAIISVPADKEALVTTDLLLEGIHFDVRYVPLMHLGYKAAVVNFSDVYAMNGEPKQITVSIGVSSRFTVEHIDAIYAGIKLACEAYGVDLVGGDTSASVTGLVISVTCLGEVEKGKAVRRSGAKETNLICVSGDLGAAYMGLQLLERENQVAAQSGDPDFQPNFAGKEYILQRQLRPEARKDIVERLRAAGVTPTAMMDVSDGLSSELLHICKASGVGCRVYEERIPIDYQPAIMAEELNMNLVTAAMNGGEDYELLFTVPLTDKDKVEHMEGVRMIGYITAPSLGAALVTRDGGELPIRAQGWNAFTPGEDTAARAAAEGAETNAGEAPADAPAQGEEK
ncbi:MAG: thiamine-phosphate kinase [Muribaculaceae bacterium]|nr:thiamine-phosphate kinase [Muribaculaceae bacterium]